MHGLIHLVLKELVVSEFGKEKWDEILTRLNVTDDATILDTDVQYEDEVTVKAIVTTSEVLGVSFDDALRVYGGFFCRYVHRGGYMRLLQSMGDNLRSFMIKYVTC